MPSAGAPWPHGNTVVLRVPVLRSSAGTDYFANRAADHISVLDQALAQIRRTRASNGVNDVGTAARSYFGGRSDATARSTVARATPSCRATCRRGTRSATSRRINAQSSTEITQPICLGGLVFDRRYGLISSVADRDSLRQSLDPPGVVHAGPVGCIRGISGPS